MRDPYSRNYQRQVDREVAEANTPQARAQAVLDHWWEAMHGPLDDPFVEIGGYLEPRYPSFGFHKGKGDPDWGR
jgi:hypothetical protein